MANEALQDRHSSLEEQARRLKDGLTTRILRQWRLKCASHVWTGWRLYVMHRRIVRELRRKGGLAGLAIAELSGDEGGEAAPARFAASVVESFNKLF